jgi:hypothetical protein
VPRTNTLQLEARAQPSQGVFVCEVRKSELRGEIQNVWVSSQGGGKNFRLRCNTFLTLHGLGVRLAQEAQAQKGRGWAYQTPSPFLTGPARRSSWQRSAKGFRISKRYLLTYPDGSRKHIDRETRDTLLLSQSAKKTDEGRYLYVGEVHTYHTFSDMRGLYLTSREIPLRRFLSGNFIFELKGKKRRELLETPEAMALRMAQ